MTRGVPSIKCSEVEDVEDEDVEMHSPSPSPPEASPSQRRQYIWRGSPSYRCPKTP